MNQPHLSVIVPAYNEACRIRSTLAALNSYLCDQSYESEVIVVDDGSTDGTLAILKAATMEMPILRIIANLHRGKAVAVRSGVKAAKGRFVIFCDADLSTPPREIARLLEALAAGAEVAIGSREGLGAQRVGEPLYRHVMGRVFNVLVSLILQQSFRDTQCGFKGFRTDIAQRLFDQSRLYPDDAPVLDRSAVTAFDVELLVLALRNRYRVVEIPVEWHYREGSKVNPLIDSAHLLGDVLRVRWNILIGRYELIDNKNTLPFQG